MKTLHIDSSPSPYPIFIGYGILSEEEVFKPYLKGKQVLIVSSESTLPSHIQKVKAAFKNYQASTLKLPNDVMNCLMLDKIFQILFKQHFRRSAAIVAVGDDVVQQTAGFAAACYQFGITFIQIPTTLTAQIDSPVGGKTGIYRGVSSSMIGTLYYPQCVVIDTDTVKDSSAQVFSLGVAELLKYAILTDADLFTWLEQNVQSFIVRDPDAVAFAIERACAKKAELLSHGKHKDEIRALFNLGHTADEAVEVGLGYIHTLQGHSMVEGLYLLADMSRRFGYLSEETMLRIKTLCELLQLNLVLPQTTGHEHMIRLIKGHRKVSGGKVRLILLKSLGDASIHEGYPSDMLYQVFHNEKEYQKPTITVDAEVEKELQSRLKEAWRLDPLTGLYNRVYFVELLSKVLTLDEAGENEYFLLCLKVDWSDRILDKYGLAALDQVAMAVGKALQPFREYALSARFEEAMFALLIRSHTQIEVEVLAEALRRKIERCVVEDEDYSMPITSSIGITEVAHGTSARDLLNHAYAACRKAAAQGGNRCEIYTPSPLAEKDGLQGMKAEEVRKTINYAIKLHRMSLWYLPIATLCHTEDEVENQEVYLNIFDEKGNKIPVGEIFVCATEADFTRPLDEWVIQQAVLQLTERIEKAQEARFFIKISGASLKDQDLFSAIASLLRSSRISPEHLVFQISETSADSQLNTVNQSIETLRNLGCRTALEHFGMIPNADSLLRRLPVDFVKIHSMYSHNLGDNPEHQRTIKDIVSLAHSLDKLTIAAGVEDANSLTLLFQYGVDYVQGYYV